MLHTSGHNYSVGNPSSYSSSYNGYRRNFPGIVHDNVQHLLIIYANSWHANPYAYDSYRSIKSGMTSIVFTDSQGQVLDFSYLPPEKELLIGMRLTGITGAPKCFSRTPERDFDGYSETGVTALNLLPYALNNQISDLIYCRTQHIVKTDDFMVSDGCYPHRLFTQAETCSSHGFCNHDNTCHCICGYLTNNCSRVHVATMGQPWKRRYFSGSPLKVDIANNASGGKVALMLMQAGEHSCSGAAGSPLMTYAQRKQTKVTKWGLDIQDEEVEIAGAKLSVVNGQVTLPHSPNVPLVPGRYTLCFCNAEKVNDPGYSNCDQDCSFVHRNQTITIIDVPRLGPLADPGSGRVVRNVSATFRMHTAQRFHNTELTSLQNGDKLYLSKNCSTGPSTIDGATSTTLLTLKNRENAFRSLFFTLPNSLFTESYTVLSLCFTTKEMGPHPELRDFAELPDKMIVILKPILATGGIAVRTITGTAPDFIVHPAPGTGSWGADGGDLIYFRKECSGAIPHKISNTNFEFATKPLRTIKYDDPIIGPDCNTKTAIVVPCTIGASSVRPRSHLRRWCGLPADSTLDSETAWCPDSAMDYDELLGMYSDDIPFLGMGLGSSHNSAKHYTSNAYSQWLQLDAGSLIVVAAIQTQGHRYAEEWVKSYAIATSKDGSVFADYELNKALKIFSANFDRESVVTNSLDDVVHAQYVRIYPKSWNGWIAIRAGLLGCFIGVRIKLPDAPTLTSAGDNVRELKACFATRRSEGEQHVDYTLLDQKLHVLPEPSDPSRQLDVIRGGIFSMPWYFGANSKRGEAGDMIRITEHDCTDVVRLPAKMPSGPSGRMVLATDAVLLHDEIMQGRINELNAGVYRICYATKSSQGDSDSDWNILSTTLRISTSQRAPLLHVPPVVNLGEDIVVGWEANNDYDGRVSDALDWLGLYRLGECQQVDYYSDSRRSQEDRQLKVSTDLKYAESQNQCFIASESLPSGQSQGEVRFSTKQYRLTAGSYEVRYFMGDSLNGAGYVCRGMQQLEDEETYRICALEAKTTSSTIEIEGSFAEGTYQHLSAQEEIPQAAEQKLPGLETFCTGPECGDV